MGRPAWLLVFALMLVSALGCHRKYTGSEPCVILISLDTVRADHLSGYGYYRDTSPGLDRLGREGVVFSRAYTPMPYTLPAHLSLLTSRLPREHGVLYNGWTFGKDFPLLQSSLGEHGYSTAAVVGSQILNRESGIDAGFDFFDDDFDREVMIGPAQNRHPQHRSTAEGVVKKSIAWIKEQDTNRPFFLFMHFYDAHEPYNLTPWKFQGRYFSDDRIKAEMKRLRIKPAFRKPTNLYDGSIHYLDRSLDEFWKFLKTRGLYDTSLIVVVADHGEGCGEHDYFGHGKYLYEEQLHVPVIIRFPGGEHGGSRSNEIISLLDVTPTILAFLGRPPLPGARGKNLLPLLGLDAAPLHPSLFFQRSWYSPAIMDKEWTPGDVFAWQEGKYKYILYTEGPDELYDLLSDPGETHNLLLDNPEAGADLRSNINRLTKEIPLHLIKSREMSPAKKDQLRALGYIQ